MNVDELLKLKRPLTAEEMAFIEEELLKAARELHALTMNICEDVEEKDAFLADKLRGSATRMLDNIEAAAAIPLSDEPLREA